MLTLSEQWLVGLKTLERLRPSLRSRHTRRRPDNPGAPDAAGSGISGEGPYRATLSTLSLQAVLERARPFSPGAVVLGMCEDGLPFLLDLTNPAPGAILIGGDPGVGKSRLLRSILASAALANPIERVVFTVLAQNPDEFLDLAQFAHCQEVLAASDPAAEGVVWDLAETVEARRRGRHAGPAMILAIDNLAAYLQFSAEEISRQLLKIIRHGPRYQVWTFAALPSQDFACLDDHFLVSFRTHLVGKIESPDLLLAFSGDARPGVPDLDDRDQFSTFFGDSWIRFWSCDPD